MNRIKRIFVALLGLCAALGVSIANAQPVTLKLAHQWPQDEKDYVVATAVKFAKEVEQRSNGDIKVRFFPAESIVKALQTHAALKSGSIDMAVYPYIYSAGAIPEMNLTLLPGLWKTHDDVYAFRKSKAWRTLEQKAEAYGFKTLSWIQISGGVASTKKPILVPQDIDGAKARAAGRMMEAALQSVGASTTSVASSETYNALQLGLLDAVWTSSGTFGSYRLYEVAKYYTAPDPYSIYFTIEPICISMKTWNKLTPAQQKILAEVGESLEAEAFEGAKHEDKRVTELFEKNKVAVTRMDAKAWEAWHELFMKTAFEEFAKRVPNGKQLIADSATPAN